MKRITTISILLLCSMMTLSCLNMGCSKRKVNRELTPAVVENPETATSAPTVITVKKEKPVVNVYLETSGSMNGYMNNGRSQFQQAVYDYVSNIENSHIASEMNLYYITDRITDKGSSISNYINSLTPTGVLHAAGSHATTDIADIVTNVLNKTANDTVSVLISDCLFSPGNVSNPQDYLENQKITIRNAITQYIDRNVNLACCVYQLNSTFDGTFFDYRNRGRKISQQRPFYIWVFGNVAHILRLRAAIPQEKFMGAQVENYWAIYNCDYVEDIFQPKYALLQPNPRNGQYKWGAGNSVSRLEKDGDGFYTFTFGADLKAMAIILGEEYLETEGNYWNLIDKESRDEFKAIIEKNTVKSSPFTYDFHVRSEKRPSSGKTTIVFDGKVPQWVYDSTDTDDSTFNYGNGLKTYGFSYICDGVYEGFHANGRNNITARFEFNIK